MHELIAVYPQQPDPELPPFQGGGVGLFSYDFARYIEKLPEHAIDDLSIPDAHFLFFDTILAFDHPARRAWIICAPGASSTGLGYRDIQDIDWPAAYDEAEAKILKQVGMTVTTAPERGYAACGIPRLRISPLEISFKRTCHSAFPPKSVLQIHGGSMKFCER